ncbi:MAG: bifunctional phosphoribosylaminoimidazolecarboxamide formyltransferase/IMP cyclohydrolase [Fimbriimonadaceae bacterium]|nr:bifunctional phosphoribosylaminoimidazolecarboxamide formyltransferase/IMP cyclohydrolase [Fimbriimonadaceae bacterium]QYK57482.1 MAG: bifunctional phosphoribosylaminoimidazolecarboxamide formyltransferase/IMP cyclohydrolase [Fimbriimonadaceae bacterium]
MRRALVSVTDKTGIADLAAGLLALGFEVVSTGGTAAALRQAGIAVTDVSDVTGFPESFDGRVKTLHPKIHGGILADRLDPRHLRQLDELQITPFEIVVVNLYQFERTVLDQATLEEAIESIDIGGPALIRAAAKNQANVTVVIDPGDYDRVLLEAGNGWRAETRRELATKAFRHTAVYDSVIAAYLSASTPMAPFPTEFAVPLRLATALRYGENPHQPAAAFHTPLVPGGVVRAKQLWGKDLSYNNILDADAAWELASDLGPGAVAIIKHGNPCGAAKLANLADSYEAARSSDPVSAFGGIAALVGSVDASAAESLTAKGNFLEVVIAERFSQEALDTFQNRSGWGADVRLLECPRSEPSSFLTVRSLRGGALVQWSDEDPRAGFKTVTKAKPPAQLEPDIEFAWATVAHVKSNAIVVCRGSRLLGTGAGQMNRVQSVRLALEQSGEAAQGAVLASDAFFPFPDSVDAAAEAGIAVMVQPGGSKKDASVIERADELGLAMVFTGIRHFRH